MTISTTGKKESRIANLFLVTGFILTLAAPLVVSLLSTDQSISETEKRALAEPPQWNTLKNDPPKFRRQFETYLDDHIGFRDSAIELNSKIKILAFNTSPSSLALLGRDRWIYFWGRSSRHVSAKRDFSGQYRYPLERLDRWYISHMAIVNDLADRGVDYLLAIAPNKQSVYPEFLPFRTQIKAGETILDQYSAYLVNKEVKGWLNLKPDFLDMKPRQQMYLRSDSHWNEHGFLYAYRKFVEWSRTRNPTIPPPMQKADLEFIPKWRRGDLVYIVGFASRFMETITSVNARTPCASIKEEIPLQEYGYPKPAQAYLYRCNTGVGKTLFLHDSFGIPVEPLLAEHYAETLASHNGNPLELDRLVSQFEPDFFIHLRVERELSSLFPSNPELTDRYIADVFEMKKDTQYVFDLDPDQLDCRNCRAQKMSGGTVITATTDDPHIPLELGQPLQLDNSVTLRLDLTTESRNTAKIYFTTYADPDFSERQSRSVKLAPGRNVRHLRIVAADPLTGFRLDPGNTMSEYLIHEFSMVKNGRY